MIRYIVLILLCFSIAGMSIAQQTDSTKVYKKRVLEQTEIDFVGSYYTQDGDNAAVTGGRGTEELINETATVVIAIPLNEDDVLTINAGISAYTSASSGNIDPFSSRPADPFVQASGASGSDVWKGIGTTYSHSSDDRNRIWTANLSLASEYDYFSFGFGASYTMLFNEKNTELTVKGNVFLDKWDELYPSELRPFKDGGLGLEDPLFTENEITGNENYSPQFNELDETARNSYAVGLNFSQILSKRLQGSIAIDLVQQSGLLSTPFQRVYFSDFDASYIDNFHLADDIERLPDTRLKLAIGGRLNYYINEVFVLRTFYRYYYDDWGVNSNTFNVELPIKVSPKFTLYPMYRYYDQSAIDYFAPYNQHLSTDRYYTSDYDMSNYTADQYGFGVTYTDVFTKMHIGSWHVKSIDLTCNKYDRSTGLDALIITGGLSIVIDK
ncbi:DUF3570 domain-containing protein [Carboxylicivirga sp. A043]|uniref:DUF3570 domain-containing protein n=1 Tax=Carboxylicivirga litoralis TaxID=2816963 RepID=UPI0021CB10DB|nr:DUF3570 domain-containing protein [Carboxylicivirga sp. A043]MCU4156106.1 DUF3570 domain-containing protein [Carboxylicivirga sp. A043]